MSHLIIILYRRLAFESTSILESNPLWHSAGKFPGLFGVRLSRSQSTLDVAPADGIGHGGSSCNLVFGVDTLEHVPLGHVLFLLGGWGNVVLVVERLHLKWGNVEWEELC